MSAGTDLSFAVNVGKAVDLYDLSGGGSKFFITVKGKYGGATEFSCNMWPSTYNKYKIETIKRETEELGDNSFSYMSTSLVKDVSFDMSYVTGTVNACTKFYVNQGDRSVSCLPGTGSGSHSLDEMIFYNLYDMSGGWYSKVKGELAIVVPQHILELKSGTNGSSVIESTNQYTLENRNIADNGAGGLQWVTTANILRNGKTSALHFDNDGFIKTVSINGSNKLDFGTNNWKITYWYRPTQTITTNTYFGMGFSQLNSQILWCGIEPNGAFRFQIDGTDNYTFGQASNQHLNLAIFKSSGEFSGYTTNVWHKFEFMRENNKVYGVWNNLTLIELDATSKNYGGHSSSSSSLMFNRYPISSGSSYLYLKGYLDELKIDANISALRPREIKEITLKQPTADEFASSTKIAKSENGEFGFIAKDANSKWVLLASGDQRTRDKDGATVTGKVYALHLNTTESWFTGCCYHQNMNLVASKNWTLSYYVKGLSNITTTSNHYAGCGWEKTQASGPRLTVGPQSDGKIRLHITGNDSVDLLTTSAYYTSQNFDKWHYIEGKKAGDVYSLRIVRCDGTAGGATASVTNTEFDLDLRSSPLRLGNCRGAQPYPGWMCYIDEFKFTIDS